MQLQLLTSLILFLYEYHTCLSKCAGGIVVIIYRSTYAARRVLQHNILCQGRKIVQDSLMRACFGLKTTQCFGVVLTLVHYCDDKR